MDKVFSLEEIKLTDPYEVFGHGMMTYFSTLTGLILAMTFMTFCFVPVLYIYSRDNYLSGELDTFNFSSLGIGNLGQTETICVFHYLGVDKPQELECKKGRISELKFYGLSPSTIVNPN